MADWDWAPDTNYETFTSIRYQYLPVRASKKDEGFTRPIPYSPEGTDFRLFAAWCEARGVAPVPAAPEVVATFLAAQASSGVKASTLARRAAAIRYAHALKGVEPPTNSEAVKATMRGIRRTLGTKKEQKAAATSERVARMVSLAPATLGGLRDQALLLLGFPARSAAPSWWQSRCRICSKPPKATG